MKEREPFLQAILDDPDDDAVRLIYADWLDDHDESAHAELIRVQCALARLPKRGTIPSRAELRKREKQLLQLPELNLLGKDQYRAKYVRGFIDDYFLSIDGIVITPPNEVLREFDLSLPLDKILTLLLSISPGLDINSAKRLASNEWINRVSHVHFFECGDSFPLALTVLAASPHLRHLATISFTDSGIPVETLPDLVLAPAIQRLRVLHLSGWFTQDSSGDDIVQSDHPLVNKAIATIVTSPKVAHLEKFVIDARGIGADGAQAILTSPHLRNVRELHIGWTNLTSVLRRSLRERFGEKLFIYGRGGTLLSN